MQIIVTVARHECSDVHITVNKPDIEKTYRPRPILYYVLDRQPVRNIPANNARGTKSRVRPAEYNRRQLRLETRSFC